jgi:predicted nuclease with TOPRIM domain
MSDQPTDPVLVLLRRMDGRLDELKADMREVEERLGLLEQTSASISRRVDRIEDRLDRIERRLDIVPAG